MCELEEYWDVVNGDIDCRTSRSASNEQQHLLLSLQEMDWEDPVLGGGEDGEALLKSKGDP